MGEIHQIKLDVNSGHILIFGTHIAVVEDDRCRSAINAGFFILFNEKGIAHECGFIDYIRILGARKGHQS